MGQWQVYEDVAENRVVCAPEGHASEADSIAAVEASLKLIADKKVHYVVDCRALLGYDASVRSVWTKAFQSVREQLSSVTFVGASPVVRMGIATVALFVREPPFRFVDTLAGLRDSTQ